MKHVAVLALLFSVNAFAAADMPEVTTCSGTLNSGTYAEFEMITTAIPTYSTATLAFDYREYVIDMGCRQYAADIPVIECIEKIPGGNKIKVQLANGKAFVSQEGSNPGINDIEKGALICK